MIALPLLFVLQISLGSAPPDIKLEPRWLSLHVQEEFAVGRGDEFVRRVTQRSARAGRFTKATLYRLRYDYSSAVREYEALRTMRPRDVWARAATFGLAVTYQSRGLVRVLDSLVALAGREASEDGDSLGMLEMSVGRAVSTARLRGPRAAVAILDSISLAPAHNDSLVLATIGCRRANVLGQAGDRRARAEFATAIAMSQALHLQRIEADCQLALYTFFLSSGRMDSAETARDRTVLLLTRLKDASSLAGLYQWEGYSLFSVGKPDRAHVKLREAQALSRTSANQLVMGWTALNLADVFAEFGQFAEAEAEIATAEHHARAIGDAYLLNQLLNARAVMARRRGNFTAAEKALIAYRQAVEQSGRPMPLHGVLVDLAALRVWRGQMGAAFALLDTAASVRVRHQLSGLRTSEINLRMCAFYLSGQLDSAAVLADTVLSLLATNQYAGRFTMNVLRAGISAAQGNATLARARLATAESDYAQWHSTLTDEQMIRRASQVAAFGLGELRGMGLVFDLLARQGDVTTVLDFDEKRRARDLRERMARFATAKNARSRAIVTARSLSLVELQRALPDERTAIVQFAAPVPAEKTTILLITRGSLRAFSAPPLDSLTPAITRFGNFVRQGVIPSDVALSLGRTLFGDVVRSLPAGVNRLMIVRDGVLHRLPIDALQIERGVSLIDHYATASAPSASVAAALWERTRRADAARILAFGDPELPRVRADSTQAAYAEAMLRGAPLKRLPASRREVRSAGQDTPSSVVYTGANASEQALKSATLRDFRIVHFATHALVDDWSLARTSMILAPGRGEDGFLTPDELSHLSFDADVVVLSACRTAAGELVGSEGIRGLAAPLLEAGARSIVATQWDVGDAAAARLSADLHRALRAGQPVIDAARTARLASRRRGDSPANWAVLAVIGDSHATPFAVIR
jgi:hypothetical protein